MGGTTSKRILTIAIASLLLIYIACQIYNVKKAKIQTETATYMKAADSFETDGYIIRNETVINYDSSKVITYTIQDGEVVSGGGTIAKIFNNSKDAKVHNEIEILTKEINNLKQLNSPQNAFATSPDSLDKQIKQELNSLTAIIQSENLLKMGQISEKLIYQLNERQVITGKVTDFNPRISELQAQIDALSASSNPDGIGVVSSKASGYFVSHIDGYENFFDYKNVLNIGLEKIRQGLPQVNVDQSSVAGKVVSGLNWYIVCIVPADKALNMPKDKEVLVELPFATTELVPVKVAAVNQKDMYSEAAVVLECSYMNKELSGIRFENIKINTDSYSGLRIPKKAIHIATVTKKVQDQSGNEVEQTKEVQGVYVVYGSEIKFKEIVAIHAYSNFVICSLDQESSELFTGETVKLYDEVVAEGTDLYDGKLIK